MVKAVARRLRRGGLPRRLRFTREGKVFTAITIGVGFAAVNTGNNLLYLLLGWMMASIVASGVMSEQVLRRLKVSRQGPPRVYAGRPFLMEITVENGKRRLPSFSVEVEDLEHGVPLDKRCYFLKVPAGKRQTTRYRHTFPRRGLHHLDGFRLSTKFPFSLFRKSRDVDAPGEVLVYPALHPVRPPMAPSRTMGEEAEPRLGPRGEFFGLREHKDGDDVRSVHWPSTARSGRLMVRELEEDAHRRATILVDNAMPELPSEAERAALERTISMAASLAADYLHRSFAVRLIARGHAVPLGNGPPHLHRVLKALALLPDAPEGTPFAGAADPRSQILVVPRQGAPVPRLPAGARVVEAR
jgi:uncharacterized protein (DUF58 family)